MQTEALIDYARTAPPAEAEAIYQKVLADEPRNVRAASELWLMMRRKLPSGLYMSQFGQDAYVQLNLLPEIQRGFFVDVGAYDGVEGSNSFFFEKALGWSGLCIEASPRIYEKLAGNRSCDCVHAAIADEDAPLEFLEVASGYVQMGGLTRTYHPELMAVVEGDARFEGARIQVPGRRLDSLLEERGIEQVDYLSVDVEGAELAVLKDFDLARFGVRAVSVENNDGNPEVLQLFNAQGYERKAILGVDELYARVRAD